MKWFTHSLSTLKGLAIFMLLSIFTAATVQAAASLALTGKSTDVKYESDKDIRISLIDWSVPVQQAAVENAWRQYQDDGDLETFLASVEDQDTRGYVFSAAATGYRIKYAWQEETDNGRHMRFLVTPGLKTRNPYLWNTPNNTSPAYTFVEVRLHNETGEAKTSLDGAIVLNEQGKLTLDRFEAMKLFATMEDSTPYYLE